MRDDRIEDKAKDINSDVNSVLTEKERDKSNTFNIIIGVSTLLIAILGATFAYFSATATSKENDVTVQSAYVSISYDGGTEIKATNLIPATQTVALSKFKKEVESIGTIDDTTLEFLDQDEYTNDVTRRCIDSKGREVCYVYQFTIESDGEVGTETAIAGSIKINRNEFKNLSYMLYEVTFKQSDGSDLVDKFGHRVVDTYTLVSQFDETYGRKDANPDNIDYIDTVFATFETPFDNYGENNEYLSTTNPVACLFGFAEDYLSYDKDDPDRCAVRGITNQEKHTFQLVIWLEETGNVQAEQGLTFQGTVALEVPSGANTGEYSSGMITGQQ